MGQAFITRRGWNPYNIKPVDAPTLTMASSIYTNSKLSIPVEGILDSYGMYCYTFNYAIEYAVDEIIYNNLTIECILYYKQDDTVEYVSPGRILYGNQLAGFGGGRDYYDINPTIAPLISNGTFINGFVYHSPLQIKE